MAEQRQSRSRNGSHNANGDGRSSGNRSRTRMTARGVVECVRSEFPSLLGRPIEAVLGVQRGEDGGWEVTVQVVELQRIPNTTDVLGSYVVTLDDDGDVVGYRRRRRYTRGQADED